MRALKSGRYNLQVRGVFIVIMFCLAFWIIPGESHAGLLDWLLPSDNAKKSEQIKPVEQAKNFTISKIEPNLKEGFISITFTEACDFNNLKNSLKVFPPARLNWHNSYSNNNVVSIKGEFKAGQDYTVVIPENLECKGRKYTKTLSAFRMPDVEPEIHFVENETVIERDSRQMIHAGVTNVDELLFQGLRIPAVLIPVVLKEIKEYTTVKAAKVAPPTPQAADKQKTDFSFEKLKKNLDQKYKAIKSLFANNPDLVRFLGDFTEDSQLFFPGKEKNNAQQFSIPLGFRADKEKGAVEIIHLKSNRSDQKAGSPVRLFRITDMGITYKISDDSMLIWITSLNTGRPLKDVSLLAFMGDSDIIPLGKTDENGVLFIKNMENRTKFSFNGARTGDTFSVSLKNIGLIAAASASDISFIEIKQSGTIKPDWVTQTRYLGDTAILLKGHVFTERGIYRPGEKVFFKGTVREYKDGEILPPSGTRPVFTILNSKGEEVFRKDIPLSEFGTASDTLEIKPYFPLGTYTVNMKFVEGAGAGASVSEKEQEEEREDGQRRHKAKVSRGVASSTFEVQEFRAPRHFVEILFKKEKKKDESYINLNKEIDLLTCNISGVYYAGGPVKHGKLRWKAYYTSTNFKRKEHSDYLFGNAVESGQELLESGESILDDKGRLTVNIPLGKEVVSGVYGIELVATVVDFDGRASTETAVYQEEPEYLLGISSHDTVVRAGDSQVLKVIIIDKNGKRIESGAVNVDVMRKEYVYVRKRNESGGVYWEDKEVYRKQLSTSLNIEKAATAFDFDFTNGGKYVLKFTYKAKDGREYTSGTMYNVEGFFYGYEYENRDRNFEKLSVFTEKKEYSPGDRIRVFVNPHKQLSSLLMTIERKGILQYSNIELKAGQKFVEIPVDKTFEPNVYISFLGVASRRDFPVYNGQFDDEAPGFLFGVVNVDIKKAVNNLKIAVNGDEHEMKTEPASEFSLKLSSKDDSGKGVETEMAVCVVDESVLALTGFKTPSLEILSRFTAPLSVFTGELRSELLKQTPFGYIRNERLTGGDGSNGGRDFATSKIRKDFRPVAYFNPSVRTDRSGNAEVKFKLPDTMTSYRVYAVACDKGSRFASSQRSLLVVKDFYIEPGTPRFFTKGDRFKFSVSAFNKTNKSGTVKLNLNNDSLINMSAGAVNFPMKSLDRTLITIEGEAVKPGTSNVIFAGDFDGKKDVVEIKVPVKSGYLLWNDVIFGTLKNAAKITYTFPEGTDRINWNELNPDDVKAVLNISGSPFLRMSKGLRYLLKYPYGCIEQTSSGIMPLSALRGLIKEGLITDINIEETDKFLKPGIERLLAMQTNTGGFGYWPGNMHPDMWGTVYAASALTHAKLAGFDVPKDRMDRVMQYLAKTMKEEGKDNNTFRGYAVYLLALNNSLDANLFKEVYKDIKNMPREGALLVLLAAKLGHHLPDKELVESTSAIIEKRWEGKGDYSFYAYYREPAIALIAGAAILKDEAVLGKLAKQLLSGVNKQGIWTSTSDTGWALVALGDYFKGKAFSDKPVQITFRQEGWPETTAVLEPKSSYTYPLEPGTFLKKPEITIFADMDMDLVYMLSLMFPRVDYASKGLSKGFNIHKTIENTDGSKNIRVGDIVKVKINIEAEDSYRYAVLDDPLPAGFVAINTAIKTEERVGAKGKGNDGGEDDYYWGDWDYETGSYKFVPNHFEMRDDRVLAFKDYVWKGQYHYSYYARAVCEGEFIMPSTKIQLMYGPDTASFTPMEKVVIKARQ